MKCIATAQNQLFYIDFFKPEQPAKTNTYLDTSVDMMGAINCSLQNAIPRYF